jgi:putative aminopeptidase FrvX
MLDNKLKEIISEFYAIPAAPFSVEEKASYVKKLIKRNVLEYEETPYFIATHLNNEPSKPKLFFISHLDHPGFIFKNKKEGIALGTLYLDKIEEYKPISVYSPEGTYLGDGSLEKISGRDNRSVEINTDFDIPKNSQGLWNVGDVRFEQDKIYGRSHDNDIATSLLLHSLRKSNNKDYEIVCVFTKHEEILQQSSFNIVHKNSLGISERDLVVNLEAMKVYSITKDDKLSNLNYKDGPVLNISEASRVYGKHGQQNVAESLINNIAEELGLQIQRGLAGGTTDARVISEFGLTDNIVTINIPNKFKHNSDGKKVRAEEVYIRDVSSLSKIISKVITSSELNTNINNKDITRELGEKYFKKEKPFYILNKRLDIASKQIVKRGYYYPVTLLDYVKDIFYKGISYIYYFVKKGLGSVEVSKE